MTELFEESFQLSRSFENPTLGRDTPLPPQPKMRSKPSGEVKQFAAEEISSMVLIKR
jgi:hypothetical protein